MIPRSLNFPQGAAEHDDNISTDRPKNLCYMSNKCIREQAILIDGLNIDINTAVSD